MRLDSGEPLTLLDVRQPAQVEREPDLEAAARLRYGQIPQLEASLKAAAEGLVVA